jgi:hypothetical protein
MKILQPCRRLSLTHNPQLGATITAVVRRVASRTHDCITTVKHLFDGVAVGASVSAEVLHDDDSLRVMPIGTLLAVHPTVDLAVVVVDDGLLLLHSPVDLGRKPTLLPPTTFDEFGRRTGRFRAADPKAWRDVHVARDGALLSGTSPVAIPVGDSGTPLYVDAGDGNMHLAGALVDYAVGRVVRFNYPGHAFADLGITMQEPA